jgi:hypothetical protein
MGTKIKTPGPSESEGPSSPRTSTGLTKLLRLFAPALREVCPAAYRTSRLARKVILMSLGSCASTMLLAGGVEAQQRNGGGAISHRPPAPGHHPTPHHPHVRDITIAETGFGLGYGPGYGPGAALTPEGDILRGAGAGATGMGNMADGIGSFLKKAAEAQSNLTDSDISINEYLDLIKLNNNNERAARSFKKKVTRDRGISANRARVRFDPDNHDIECGDALNVLALELTGPRVAPMPAHAATVQLPVAALRTLPLRIDSIGISIAPGRLRVDDRWPELLQDPTFARRRRAYERAVEVALEQATLGNPSKAAATAVERSIIELRRGYETVARTASPVEQSLARRFLDALSKSAQMLKEPSAHRALRAVLSNSERSLPGALALLRKHRLRFGPSESDDERAAYHELYSLMRYQAELLVANEPRSDRADVSASSSSGIVKSLEK